MWGVAPRLQSMARSNTLIHDSWQGYAGCTVLQGGYSMAQEHGVAGATAPFKTHSHSDTWTFSLSNFNWTNITYMNEQAHGARPIAKSCGLQQRAGFASFHLAFCRAIAFTKVDNWLGSSLLYYQTMEEYSDSFSSTQYVVRGSTDLSRVLPDYGRILW